MDEKRFTIAALVLLATGCAARLPPAVSSPHVFPVKRATDAMRSVTFVVEAGGSSNDTEYYCSDKNGDRYICVAAGEGARFKVALEDALRRAGFKVASSRLTPYDFALAVGAYPQEPKDHHPDWGSPGNLTSWPERCNEFACHFLEAVVYSLYFSPSRVTSGLRRDDSGGAAARVGTAGAKQLDRAWTACVPRPVAFSQDETPSAALAAAFIASDLATCDALESYAQVLAKVIAPAPTEAAPLPEIEVDDAPLREKIIQLASVLSTVDIRHETVRVGVRVTRATNERLFITSTFQGLNQKCEVSHDVPIRGIGTVTETERSLKTLYGGTITAKCFTGEGNPSLYVLNVELLQDGLQDVAGPEYHGKRDVKALFIPVASDAMAYDLRKLLMEIAGMAALDKTEGP